MNILLKIIEILYTSTQTICYVTTAKDVYVILNLNIYESFEHAHT